MKRPTKAKTMVVAGVMSGTSADGVDVALCRIAESADGEPRIRLIGAAAFPYPAKLRTAVLAAMDAKAMSVADLSRLHWRLGEVYADAIEATTKQFATKLDLVGCHGQTIYHQGKASRFLGREIRSTWQVGESSVIAEKLRVPVVSDFRTADLAAGGQAAPLVPMLDYVMMRSAKVHRVLQNLGGIANLTVIRAGAGVEDVVAFDTGPANMVIDACMMRLFGRRYDRDGATARRGRVIQSEVDRIMRQPYFSAPPPKSCGREQYGDAFTSNFIAACRRHNATDADIIATATALTAQSILDTCQRFVWPQLRQSARSMTSIEYVVAGGGAKNSTLMRMLRDGMEPLGVKMRQADELGVPAQAKEAMAFALLAWLTWHNRPGNVPRATGARREVVLGKVAPA